MNEPSKPPQRIALITGSARGLGAAIATSLSQRGYHVAVNDIDVSTGQKLVDHLQSNGAQAAFFPQDVSQTDQAKHLVDAVQKKWGSLDVLVNNAGIVRDAMLMKLEEKNWDAVIQLNLKAPFILTQACAPGMKAKNWGRIINIASIAWNGNVGQTNYSATKAGLVGMTKTWALELSKYGITVNAVAPGFIDTPMTQGVPSAVIQKFTQKIPCQRMGQPEDIGNAVAFLASQEASYISGQVLGVDGGLSIGIGGLL